MSDHPEPEIVDEDEPGVAAPAAAEIVRAIPPAQQQNPMAVGQVLADSGFFRDAQGAAQAAVKVMAGAELGFGPIASMTNVHVIPNSDGSTSVQIGGALLAARIQGSDRYRFRIVQSTNAICELAFFEKNPATGEWEELQPHVTWEIADAQRANLMGKFNWKSYPKKMLYWRAVSDGADMHCSDLFGGNTPLVYEAFVDEQQPAAALPGGPGSTGRVGLPGPTTPQAQAPAAAAGGGQAPRPSGQRQQATAALITAAQRRKLWKMTEEAGIKENEQLIRMLIFWTADVEHSDRIPRGMVDEVFKAIADHDAVVDLIVAEARRGDQRARLTLEAYMPDALPEVEEPTDETDDAADRIGAEVFEGEPGEQGTLT